TATTEASYFRRFGGRPSAIDGLPVAVRTCPRLSVRATGGRCRSRIGRLPLERCLQQRLRADAGAVHGDAEVKVRSGGVARARRARLSPRQTDGRASVDVAVGDDELLAEVAIRVPGAVVTVDDDRAATD